MAKARGPSKAQTILNEARNRRGAAQQAVSDAYAAWQMAQAVLAAHAEAYEALERSLTRATPRRLPKQEPVKKGTVTEPVCAKCGFVKDGPTHDMAYSSSHPYVLVAAKRSTRKGAATNNTANTEVETVNATAAGASGD